MKNKATYKKIALALSSCAIIIWAFLGTGASLAWFTDSSSEINNIFHFAEFELKVSYYDENDDWAKIEADTKVFNEEALYEPGYVEVVYLKVENLGTVPFEFFTAVNVNDCRVAKNVFDEEFLLQDYLKFGVITGLSREEVESRALDREVAKENSTILLEDVANMPLHNYYTDTMTLQPDTSKAYYLAIIVRMPEQVGNDANYRGSDIPTVELGVTVKADQIRG